jgi:hypothetical protein
MTAFRDAFEKAGMNTAGAELFKLATDALRNHGGSADKAAGKFSQLLRKRNDLLHTLALDFLRRVAVDMAAAAPPAISMKDVDVRKHKRQRPRTQGERAGAFAAATTSVQAMRTIFDERRIDGRAVGDLAWGELLRACHTRALIAASALQQTNEATEDAILLNKIEAFARVDDHSRKVRDVLSAADLERLAEEAHREAPRMIAMGMEHYANMIEQRSGLGEIAP